MTQPSLSPKSFSLNGHEKLYIGLKLFLLGHSKAGERKQILLSSILNGGALGFWKKIY